MQNYVENYTAASSFERTHHKHGRILILLKGNIHYKTEITQISIEIHFEITAIKLHKGETSTNAIHRSLAGDQTYLCKHYSTH